MKKIYRITQKDHEYFFSKESDMKKWYKQTQENGFEFIDDYNFPFKSGVNMGEFHTERWKVYQIKTQDEIITIKFSKIEIS
jgi:hypothetical protein